MKLPAFGKELFTRQQFKNLPFLAIVCVGDWDSAKQWNLRPNVCAMVLTPGQSPVIVLPGQYRAVIAFLSGALGHLKALSMT